ncbi:hypothetical protein BJF79_16685 [Actinomadura sp. CNU-125]|uniref:hypothetical protein n=1 Tax=Actinomadura sp. CNU-125 TaxID=1904961 RepID=UPI000960A930|nr:hypothetical protein [Actinomadura sp. CNU-125]OLT19375.1 hypothetical protein BJF79_16685 [Actinomadura sp. CNU-125]
MEAELTPGPVGRRWTAVRRAAGHGAAACLSLYLVVKVVWVVAGLLGAVPSDVGGADWIVLNAVTVGMAGVGIALGLALARDWGRRIPAAPLLLVAWIGAGFLVPMLPFMVLGVLVDTGGGGSGGEGTMPAWEAAFLGIGFIGMAAGLAVALPLYLRERWPAAFAGRLGGRGDARGGRRARARAVRGGAVPVPRRDVDVLGGGRDARPGPRARDRMNTDARLLLGTSAVWALVGAWAVATRRPGTPAWLPTSLGFTASGSLFAWSAWKLPLVFLRPGDYAPVERTAVALVQHGLGIAAGALLLAAIVEGAGGTESRARRRGST